MRGLFLLLCSLCLLASQAGAASRLVIHREGRPAPRRALAPTTISLPDPAALPERRPFPHDLRPPGREPVFRPLSELLRPASPAAPAVDTLRVAILRVDFLTDRLGAKTTGDGRFDLRTGVTDVLVDPPPHDKRYFEQHAEALRRYYDVQSYGSLAILPTVFPAGRDSAYHLSDLADYGEWAVSQEESVIVKADRFVRHAVAAADLDPAVDFAAFDAFVVVHAGADFQGDIDRNSGYDVPSFTLTLGDSLLADDDVLVERVLVLPETTSQDGRLAALNGVFAHEFGHILGLPDLYNIFTGTPQVGYWSLMDSGENIPAIVYDPETDTEFLAEGIFPTSLDPWCKLQLFSQAVQVEAVGESFAEGLEAFVLNPRLPLVSIDGTEYFLVENRALDVDGIEFPNVFQDTTTGVFLGPVDDPETGVPDGHYEYDAVLPGGGILIWHIDDKIIVPGLGTTGGVNFFTGLRGIAIEEADRISDQGVANFGVPEDAFYTGNNDWFAPGEIPGTEANDGAYTGISIRISGAPARTMGVDIRRPLARDGWPVFVLQTEETFTRPGRVLLTDVSGDGRSEFLFTVDVDLIGQPQPRRGLVALDPGGQSLGGAGNSLVTEVNGRLYPELAASERFVLTPGGADTTVVAVVENGGKTYLWAAAGGDIDDTNLLETTAAPALTAPVLLPRGPGNPGWVLTAGSGSLHAVTVPGTLVYSDTALVPTPPVTPPTVNPGGADGYMAAVGYSGGAVAFYHLDGGLPSAVLTLEGEVRHILSGVVSERGSSDFVILSADSAVVAAASGDRVFSRWALPFDAGLSVPPALGDVDGDGKCELVAADADGRVGAMNLDGSFALGWPRAVEGPVRFLGVVDLDGDGALDVLALDGADRFHGWSGRGRRTENYPRVYGAWPRPLDPLAVVSAGLAGMDGDGTLTGMATTLEGILTAVRFPEARARAGDWLVARGGIEGWNYQENPVTPRADRPILETGDTPFLVYPNPARGDGVEIRFLLEAGETARIQILDLAGRPLTTARLDLRGGPKEGENAVRWDLANVASGLYFCRLERSGGKESGVEMAKIVVMR